MRFFQVPPGMSQGVGTAPGMISPQQAMFMQQQGMTGGRGPFGQQGPAGLLQGPLAYLEKTTSNIGNFIINFFLLDLGPYNSVTCFLLIPYNVAIKLVQAKTFITDIVDNFRF